MLLLAAHDNVFKTGRKWLNLKLHLNYVSRHSVQKKNTQKKQKQKTKKNKTPKKSWKTTLTAIEIGYFPQFAIFNVGSGSRQSQINLFIYYFLLTVFIQSFQPVHMWNFNSVIQNGKFFRYHIQAGTRPNSRLKNQTLCNFWMQSCPNVSVCTVRNLTFLL